MRLFGEVSAWLQMSLMLGTLVLAKLTADCFPKLFYWRLAWGCFAVGFAGMLISRVLVLLIVYEYETSFSRFLHRFGSPLQASFGLFFGMLFAYLFARRMAPAPRETPLPRPAGFRLDRESRVLSWDAGCERIFGWTAAEVAQMTAEGKTFHEITSPERLRWHQTPIIDRHLAWDPTGLKTNRYTLTVLHRQAGEEFTVRISLSGEPGPNGSLHFTGVAWRMELAL